MATDRAWTIRGVNDRTRDAALEAAHAAGLNVGEWVDQALAKAVEQARHPKPPAATSDEVAALLEERLRPIEATLGRIAERLAAREEVIGQETRPEPAGETAPPSLEAPETERTEVQAQTRRGRRREIPEPMRARIDELHTASRSMYAISKELGLPYNTVYAYVKHSGRA